MKQKIYDIYGKEIFSPIHGYPTKIKEKYLYPRLKLRYYKNRLKYGKAAPNPFEIIYVDPEDIEYYKYRNDYYFVASDKHKFKKWKDAGKIKEGNWDKLETKIDEMPKYRAVKQHFEEGVSWEETRIYDHMLKMIEVNGSADGCTNRKDLEERYNRIDNLYENIKDSGYKRQSEINKNRGWKAKLDEITVSIGRKGDFIFGDGGGWHRLSIAKILNLEEIPVRVLVRHKKWQEKRSKVLDHPRSIDNKHLNHPDINFD